MKKLEGKVAVVTGASKGIGASIAKHLAMEGASVVVNYASSRAGADRVVAEIALLGGKAIAAQADLTKKADVVRLFAEGMKAFGRLDILVNNAGIYLSAPLAEITEEHFHDHFNLNVLGVLLASQEAIKFIGPEGGSIINISSIVSTLGPPGNSVYSGTKGAVNTITKSLAKELGSRKIRVNCVAPSLVETEGTQANGAVAPGAWLRNKVESENALGRIGQPQDIATVAVFLATEDAAWVTGETWFVTGGF
jgi:3-oxoacyl-[acyl-carrier protein] reductase